ncbi:MAG: helix-turn-helix domain-containing protein [Lachnospiraceae bacterium]|nr:helix-turn-helix domain-containing protein [Lachnospiraceae bacterium]
MNEEQRSRFTTTFLTALGKKIRKKRINRAVTQEILADEIDVSRVTLSRFENGETDLGVAKVGLIGSLLDTPVKDFFDDTLVSRATKEAAIISFKEMVNDRRKRYERKKSTMDRGTSVLRARVYERDGMEYVVPAKATEKKKSLRERYLDGEIETNAEPFTEEELLEYFVTPQGNRSTPITYVDSVSQLLSLLDREGRSTSLHNSLIDYTIEKTIIEPIIRKDETAERAYAYYLRLLRNVAKNNDL